MALNGTLSYPKLSIEVEAHQASASYSYITPVGSVTYPHYIATILSHPAFLDGFTVVDEITLIAGFGRDLADTFTLDDVFIVGFTKVASDSVTMSETMVFDVSKVLADTASLADAFAAAFTMGTIADTVTPSDSVALQPGIVPADSVTMSEATVFTVGKNPTDSVTMSEALVVTFTKGTIADSVTMSESLAVQLFEHTLNAEGTTVNDLLVN